LVKAKGENFVRREETGGTHAGANRRQYPVEDAQMRQERSSLKASDSILSPLASFIPPPTSSCNRPGRDCARLMPVSLGAQTSQSSAAGPLLGCTLGLSTPVQQAPQQTPPAPPRAPERSLPRTAHTRRSESSSGTALGRYRR